LKDAQPRLNKAQKAVVVKFSDKQNIPVHSTDVKLNKKVEKKVEKKGKKVEKKSEHMNKKMKKKSSIKKVASKRDSKKKNSKSMKEKVSSKMDLKSVHVSPVVMNKIQKSEEKVDLIKKYVAKMTS